MKSCFCNLLQPQLPCLLVAVMLVLGWTCCIDADEKPDRVTIATWNLEWFYDDYKGDNFSDLSKELSAPSRADWDWKLSEVASVVATMRPTIMCFQEVESQRVLWRLTQTLERDHQLKYRVAFIQGSDHFTEQDVGIIYQSGLVEFSRREQSREMFDSQQFYNVSKHLFAEFQWGEGDQRETLTVVNVHFRARPEAADLRQRQARLIRAWIDDLASEHSNVAVVGDFNTEDGFGSERRDGEVAILRGLNNANQTDDLYDAHEHLPQAARVTHLNGRQYDRIFYSAALQRDAPRRKDLVMTRAATHADLVIKAQPDGEEHWDRFYGIPATERDISDHYPLMVEFVFK